MGFELTPAFWSGLFQIILVNIILSGDNALVIALACRNLDKRHQKPAILIGSAGAIVLRIIFVLIVDQLLKIGYLKLVGGLLLLWIGVKLVQGEEEGEGGVKAAGSLWTAIRTIIIADAVMSLDNAIAIAAAAEQAGKGDATRVWTLITLGLVITIPIIVVGATIIMRIMQRYPIVILIGGALLGFVAGEMLITDQALHHWVEGHAGAWFKPAHAPGSEAYAAWLKDTLHYIELGAGLAGAVVTIVIGRWLLARAAKRKAVDLAAAPKGPAVDLAAPNSADRKE